MGSVIEWSVYVRNHDADEVRRVAAQYRQTNRAFIDLSVEEDNSGLNGVPDEYNVVIDLWIFGGESQKDRVVGEVTSLFSGDSLAPDPGYV